MDFNFSAYSIVIRGNAHNPTVLSESFFIKTGIISDESEIDRTKLIVTPGLFQANLKGKTNLIVEPNSLNVSSLDFFSPYDVANKYCKNLKFIKSNAIGINFDVIVEEYDFDLFFKPINFIEFKNSMAASVTYNFMADEKTVCNVSFFRQEKSKTLLKFNFHKNIPNLILGDLGIDFIQSAEIYKQQAIEFIKNTLK